MIHIALLDDTQNEVAQLIRILEQSYYVKVHFHDSGSTVTDFLANLDCELSLIVMDVMWRMNDSISMKQTPDSREFQTFPDGTIIDGIELRNRVRADTRLQRFATVPIEWLSGVDGLEGTGMKKPIESDKFVDELQKKYGLKFRRRPKISAERKKSKKRK